MITYQQEHQQTIPDSEVIVIGIGGAGANIIDRIALDGMENAQQLALNTDSRTLSRTVAKEKIQMGVKLTRGLGCGGDPDLGLQAAIEVEEEIRGALKGYKMVFICVGLGGGTSSGAAPLVTKIARESGAFVVVFATMPFSFEGMRRREQAETALNELSVLANALVTFDNGRMGELVLASQGIHEAFAAADHMINESIRAVTRLVIKPGLVNIGLDELMTSLRATRSRCLFGSGIATGENRSQKALKNALNSPLLDKGQLLKNTQTALVHVCGGAEMTLYEVELLMQKLAKTVPKNAHILFGAAVDETMGESLSVTIISSLPEEQVAIETNEEASKETNEVSKERTPTQQVSSKQAVDLPAVKVKTSLPDLVPATPPTSLALRSLKPVAIKHDEGEIARPINLEPSLKVAVPEESKDEQAPEPTTPLEAFAPSLSEDQTADEPILENSYLEEIAEQAEADPPSIINEEEPESEHHECLEKIEAEVEEEIKAEEQKKNKGTKKRTLPSSLKQAQQAELLLNGKPRGKFEGETPTLIDGEDLDIPPFLRNRK